MQNEISRRRTFAIISHPDAGKTTITEKILWLGGAISTAGEVKGKAGTKAATSDWMKMEQQRGVSITSSVMQLDYQGLRINLLDTPGHKDFGEDTYRTLVAVDSAAMLIDAAKGVEAQTRKLYEVCRLRRMPLFTFANKVDREGKSPLELIDDIEATLQMKCFPVTWPIGMGGLFKGLFHRSLNKIFLLSKEIKRPTRHQESSTAEIEVSSWQDPLIKDWVGGEIYKTFMDEMEVLEGVLDPFSNEEFLAGRISPLTFGSAKYLWGIDLFLDLFVQLAPAPLPRLSVHHDHCQSEQWISPHNPEFSGFVFKMQANMDKRHRDRVVFIRICSGRFERGMKVFHCRLGREIRINYANQFLAQQRETVNEAFAGDIIGINDSEHFQIGDTITGGMRLQYTGIPRFSPEHFARVTIKESMKRRQLDKAIRQLVDEGSIQMFYDPKVGWQDPILAVVGLLQFDVLMFRLNDEYGLNAKLEVLPFKLARWPRDQSGQPYPDPIQTSAAIYHDRHDHKVILLEQEWDLKWLQEKNPDAVFAITESTLDPRSKEPHP